MIIDNFKKEISPLLGLCIHACYPSRRSSLVKETAQANATAQEVVVAQWQSIMKKLNAYLNLMKANNAPPLLVSEVFTKIFSFINIKFFNSFLLRRELCTSSNGKYVGAGLAVLQQWCVEATDEYVGSAWNELRHVRQAAEFLRVIHQKQDMTLEEITRELCPVLSMQQLFRISTMYWDDRCGMRGVSSDLIAKLRIMMADDSSNATSGSLTTLDEEDSSIPFTVEEISKSMQQVDVNNINEPLQLIRESPGFSFLFTREDSS
ncbi:unnamed protein product [Eruca vesicaria subsp. sativa]|uniref:Dilute domain-containing protein n=1 Tax=Eruca vesicaria subsp. sativa TaxID=29727 RepID=A0ABC8K2V2_ERUVS|nr:unnamed protein product [Eruca vesicaria subsp. sativa]